MNYSNLSKKLFDQWLAFIKTNLSGLRLLDRESTVMIFTSLIVGIGAGLGAVFFRRLIDWSHDFSYWDMSGLLAEWYPLLLILIPAVGGAIVGPLAYYFAREA